MRQVLRVPKVNTEVVTTGREPPATRGRHGFRTGQVDSPNGHIVDRVEPRSNIGHTGSKLPSLYGFET